MKKMRNMVFALIMVLVIALSCIPALASDDPIVYKDTITVSEDGGRYQVGFVNVEFKKRFLGSSFLPVDFAVEIYAENGVVYIDFEPDFEIFNKKVHIRIDSYEGLIYDRALKKNIYVSIKKRQILADHFSRYCMNF